MVKRKMDRGRGGEGGREGWWGNRVREGGRGMKERLVWGLLA